MAYAGLMSCSLLVWPALVLSGIAYIDLVLHILHCCPVAYTGVMWLHQHGVAYTGIVWEESLN